MSRGPLLAKLKWFSGACGVWLLLLPGIAFGQRGVPQPGLTYYVDSVLGSDENLGLTPDAPLKSLKKLMELYGHLSAETCTLDLAGDQVGAFDMSGTRATIQQWPGHAPARIRGSRDPKDSGNDWSPWAGTTYRCYIGSGRLVGNVCARWGSLFATLGRTAGWYRVGQLEAGALTEDQRYFYDSGSGYLYFRDDSIGDPKALVGDDRVFWQDASLRIGLTVRVGEPGHPPHNQPVTVSGITFMHYNTGRGVSYGLIAGGTDHTVSDCTFFDCEVHAIAFTSVPNINSHAIRCVAYGAGAGVVGQVDYPSLFVTHTGELSPDAKVRGTRFVDCVAYCYGLEDPQGQPLDPGDFVHGFYGHTSGTPGSTVDDYEFDHCTTYHFANRGYNFYCGDSGAVGDPYSWSAYPVRAVDCRSFGGFGVVTSANIAFERCFFDFRRGPEFPNFGPGLITVPTGHSNLFESCIIVANTDVAGGGVRAVYGLNTGAHLVRINTTTIDLGALPGCEHAIVHARDHDHGFVLGTSGFRSDAFGCLDYFAFRNPANRYFANDGPLCPLSGPEACYHSEGCWIDGVSEGKFSMNNLISTSGGFRSELDPQAVIGVDPLLIDPASADPDVAGRWSDASPVGRDVFIPTVHAALGFNGAPFGGQRGAIQAGPPVCPCDWDRDGRVGSADFFAFVNDFLGDAADFNNDGVTNSQDFFDFLNCFFAPARGCGSAVGDRG